MINPRFAFLVKEIKEFLNSGISNDDVVEPNSVLQLGEVSEAHRRHETNWIVQKVCENSEKGVRTVLVVLYDLITLTDLESLGVKRDDLYLIRLLPKGNRAI